MVKNLINQAVNAAINQDWQQAINVNLEILELFPDHIPTLNRLAKAYKEIGQIQRALDTYQQTLSIDRYNIIARKNLSQLEIKSDNHIRSNKKINADFIEEPGKTKTIPLTRLGDPALIRNLEPGQIVKLTLKKHNICVTTEDDQHIGALTDDIAYQLKDFLSAGNQYQAIVKCASNNKIHIFIRETLRVDKYKHIPTFAF